MAAVDTCMFCGQVISHAEAQFSLVDGHTLHSE
jgi:hypothetical protein